MSPPLEDSGGRVSVRGLCCELTGAGRRETEYPELIMPVRKILWISGSLPDLLPSEDSTGLSGYGKEKNRISKVEFFS